MQSPLFATCIIYLNIILSNIYLSIFYRFWVSYNTEDFTISLIINSKPVKTTHLLGITVPWFTRWQTYNKPSKRCWKHRTSGEIERWHLDQGLCWTDSISSEILIYWSFLLMLAGKQYMYCKNIKNKLKQECLQQCQTPTFSMRLTD